MQIRLDIPTYPDLKGPDIAHYYLNLHVFPDTLGTKRACNMSEATLTNMENDFTKSWWYTQQR